MNTLISATLKASWNLSTKWWTQDRGMIHFVYRLQPRRRSCAVSPLRRLWGGQQLAHLLLVEFHPEPGPRPCAPTPSLTPQKSPVPGALSGHGNPRRLSAHLAGVADWPCGWPGTKFVSTHRQDLSFITIQSFTSANLDLLNGRFLEDAGLVVWNVVSNLTMAMDAPILG